jgi:hypothetical protein
MDRVWPETHQEKVLMAMGAAYVEENFVLEDLYEVIENELERPDRNQEEQEFVEDQVCEIFGRLDMNFDPEIKGDCLELLQEMWNVADRASALAAIENLRHQGHRTKFNVLKANAHDAYKFKEIFKFDFDESEEVQLSDEDFERLAEWIRRANDFVPKVGILAWDAARYIHLVRLCFFANYLNPKEAWEKINLLAPIVKDKFKDWSEFSQSFLIGRTFWAGEEDPDLKAVCERLLGHKASPWMIFELRL